MTVEQFNDLDEEQKKAAIFDAKKVSERFEKKVIKYELFQIDNFFIETKTSLQHKFKRVIATFTRNEVPTIYASKIIYALSSLLLVL
ncbi:hypothetical protein [Segetibacter aerophilus]|nr:hypothetical protein [Segetibacter aerophilus]